MKASRRRSNKPAYVFRMAVVAAFSFATALVVATRANIDARPALAPLALAIAAAVILWAVDRRSDALRDREVDTGTRWMRIGFYLMAGSTVLGVANTWYAFLDPSRNGWVSGLFLIGSVLAAAAFLLLDPSRRNVVEP